MSRTHDEEEQQTRVSSTFKYLLDQDSFTAEDVVFVLQSLSDINRPLQQ